MTRTLEELQKEVADIKAIADKLPQNATADWENTNHYELSGTVNGQYEHAWISLSDVFVHDGGMWCDTEYGKAVGAILDAAALLPKSHAIITDLASRLEVAVEALHAAYTEALIERFCQVPDCRTHNNALASISDGLKQALQTIEEGKP